ncbi:uncharacterized protein Dwil_GK10871 [Drosophila willistoni]|uniref:Carbonic anhydrase n=1 Tax=Drosophila willistoni TaxID=7260 RepID=B4N9V3_DROWI|nr:carbonic anhydrase 2 isoform X2 [Drosophila willistoni]EDW81708.2 uncharacterized protein Dwil_GK10871 [Drosophila willistoni]
MQSSVFHRLFLLLPLAYQHTSNDADHKVTHWNYEYHGTNWGGTCQSGVQQSPIQLAYDKAYTVPLPRIVFKNYDVRLKEPLILENNGHSVHMDIPETQNGNKPYIMGGLLKGRYQAEGFHFHWGSPKSRGSEHSISERRFDVEMHIVHRNVRYDDLKEAVKHDDGIAVLGIMFKIVRNPDRIYPGLNKVFAEMSNVVKYKSESEISGSISVGQLLGDLDTRNFFTYKGSLTTPDCNEAVTWTVFSQVLPIPFGHVAKLWRIRDSSGHSLINNYRSTQPLNGRSVFYRTTIDGTMGK